jgi:ABC-type nitrate/sulfonate/bicarbonate transport system substrate-binding protein
MRRTSVTGLLALAVALAACGRPLASGPAAQPSSAPAAASSAPAGRPALTVAYGGTPGTTAPLWVAAETGAFEKRGVQVTLKQVATALSTPVLLSKDVDLFSASASPVITAHINGGVDEVYVASIANTNTTSLFARPEIKSGADLKGRVVATDKPGTPIDFYTRDLLSRVGLKPTDVILRRMGDSAVTIPAFLSGQADAVGAGTPNIFQLHDKGYNELADTVGSPYVAMGFFGLRSRLDELSPAIPGFLLGIRDAIHIYNDQPDVAKRVLQKYTKETDQSILDRTYEFYKTKVKYDPSLFVPNESLQALLDFFAGTTIPEARNYTPDQLKDMRFVQRLPKP